MPFGHPFLVKRVLGTESHSGAEVKCPFFTTTVSSLATTFAAPNGRRPCSTSTHILSPSGRLVAPDITIRPSSVRLARASRVSAVGRVYGLAVGIGLVVTLHPMATVYNA